MVDHPDLTDPNVWRQRHAMRFAEICHCASEAQALELLQALERRFADCHLRLLPQKTKIVYCKDANRPGEYPVAEVVSLKAELARFMPTLVTRAHNFGIPEARELIMSVVEEEKPRPKPLGPADHKTPMPAWATIPTKTPQR